MLVATMLFAATLAAPTTASALTVNKATARANESTNTNVIGGQPTRVTWEGTVAAEEEVASVSFVFPQGSWVAEDANIKATILDGTKRVETEQNTTLDNAGATIEFPNNVASGHLIRVEIYKLALPAEGGAFTLTGSYTNAQGESIDLAESPAIKVISLTPTDAIIAWLDQQPWVEAWNSVLFLKIFLNPQMIVAAAPNLFTGFLRSLGLVLVGFPLAIPIGLAISFLRMSKLRILRFISGIYVNVIRGTPLFLQIYIAFFGLPFLGVSIDDYLLGIIVLAMNSSAYLAEIFRAGIQSIHKGQFEASMSLGMNGIQTMFFVIIPQTVRRVIPTATSEFILLYKDTALLAAVGVMEMMMFGKSMVATSGNMTPYIVAACYYLIVTLPLTRIISNFERKLAAAEGNGSAKSKKKGLFGLFAKKEPATEIVRVAPLSAVDADKTGSITPEEHMSGHFRGSS